MSAHSLRYPRRASSLAACRRALQGGFLTKNVSHWTFGRRRFHPATVNQLIDNGEAVRVGRCVVKWSPA